MNKKIVSCIAIGFPMIVIPSLGMMSDSASGASTSKTHRIATATPNHADRIGVKQYLREHLQQVRHKGKNVRRAPIIDDIISHYGYDKITQLIKKILGNDDIASQYSLCVLNLRLQYVTMLRYPKLKTFEYTLNGTRWIFDKNVFNGWRYIGADGKSVAPYLIGPYVGNFKVAKKK